MLKAKFVQVSVGMALLLGAVGCSELPGNREQQGVALGAAGLAEQEMIRRLEATGQVFELTDQQKKFLQDKGVHQNVVSQMTEINRSARDRLLQSQSSSVISSPQRSQ